MQNPPYPGLPEGLLPFLSLHILVGLASRRAIFEASTFRRSGHLLFFRGTTVLLVFPGLNPLPRRVPRGPHTFFSLSRSRDQFLFLFRAERILTRRLNTRYSKFEHGHRATLFRHARPVVLRHRGPERNLATGSSGARYGSSGSSRARVGNREVSLGEWDIPPRGPSGGRATTRDPRRGSGVSRYPANPRETEAHHCPHTLE